jgi:hypothetical protein
MVYRDTSNEDSVSVLKGLISQFIDGKISAQDFQLSYFSAFKSSDHLPEHQFKVLDELFADVDDYTADVDLRRRAGGLSDDELRTCAMRAYQTLFR